MKRFIVKILLFLALVAAVDWLIGLGTDRLAASAKGGQGHKNHEIAELVTPDVLVLGSSRSTHHYAPEIFTSVDSQFYIAGQDGNGIIMMYPVLRHIAGRHMPKTVIYDLTPSFDMYQDDAHRYLRYIRPLWHRNDVVDSVITTVDKTERYKLLSNAFKYNSSFPSLIKARFLPDAIYEHGYIPLHGRMSSDTKDNIIDNHNGYSSLKLYLFDQLVNFCKTNGIDLVFVMSPYYSKQEDEDVVFFKEWADKHDVPFYDFSKMTFPEPVNNYYSDPAHLNHEGAKAFSKTLLDSITCKPLRAGSPIFVNG